MLERKIDTKNDLLHSRIGTGVISHGVGTAGRGRLRISTGVVGEGEVVVQGHKETKIINSNLPGQILRKGVAELDLFDLEEGSVEDHGIGTPELPVLGNHLHIRELGILVILLPGVVPEVGQRVAIGTVGTPHDGEDIVAGSSGAVYDEVEVAPGEINIISNFMQMHLLANI